MIITIDAFAICLLHRCPKLLTDRTTIIAIAPMLRASGVSSEVIRPITDPVLGKPLIVDELIDVFLPVFHLAVNKWQWCKIHGLDHLDVIAPTITYDE